MNSLSPRLAPVAVSMSTNHKCPKPERARANTKRRPSRLQAGEESSPGPVVSWKSGPIGDAGRPLDTRTVQSLALPVASETNAIRAPSGDHTGCVSLVVPDVNWRSVPELSPRTPFWAATT